LIELSSELDLTDDSGITSLCLNDMTFKCIQVENVRSVSFDFNSVNGGSIPAQFALEMTVHTIALKKQKQKNQKTKNKTENP